MKCRPAVGAATEPASFGKHGLVADLVFLVRVAMEIGRNRNAAETLEVGFGVEFHYRAIRPRESSTTRAIAPAIGNSKPGRILRPGFARQIHFPGPNGSTSSKLDARDPRKEVSP